MTFGHACGGGRPPLEFSRVTANIERRVPRGKGYCIEADAEERTAVARRFAPPAVDALTARARARIAAGGRMARAAENFATQVGRPCCVSLWPVSPHLEESFDAPVAAAPPPERLKSHGVRTVFPTPRRGGFDLGEGVAEHPGVALEPFPRAQRRRRHP